MSSGAIGRARRGAVAGAISAAVWAALEPIASRAFGTGYTDVALLGRMATRGPAWRVVGAAAHLAFGAMFGAGAAAAGVRTPAAGALAASAEGLVAWPLIAVFDRVHPDRRDGLLGPLVTDRRVFAQEAAMHAAYGALLGLLLSRAERARAPGDG